MGIFVRDNTSVDAVILTSDNVTNPISIMSARPILIGYPGWMFNYGFSYTQRQHDIENMYQGKDTETLLKKYDISYVYIGASEQKYNPDIKYFSSHYPLVYSTSGGQLFKTSK
jgi:uncharacterized membrane protein